MNPADPAAANLIDGDAVRVADDLERLAGMSVLNGVAVRLQRIDDRAGLVSR